jgi:hypothetical protein
MKNGHEDDSAVFAAFEDFTQDLVIIVLPEKAIYR